MIIAFLQGILLGFTAAVPLGPINLLIMNEALKSYKNGVFVGLGAMSADITYLLLILFGLSIYFNNPVFLNILSFLGAFFLLFIAYSIYVNRNKKIEKINIDKKSSLVKHYLKGYVLTLVNPYTIAFWLSIATLSVNKMQPIALVCGMFFSIFIWITLMPYFVFRTKHLISQKIYSKIALVSSITFCFFAFGMLIRVFLEIFN